MKNTTLNRLLLRNRCVLRDKPTITKSKPKKVNLNAWFTVDHVVSNVGDELSKVIVGFVCDKFGIDINKKVRKTKHLYAIGSILLGFQDATIWGSGFGFDRPKGLKLFLESCFHKCYHSVDIRAVRGPETARILKDMGYDCPEIYGDPAILLPLFYPKEPLFQKEYVLIPHYSRGLNYDDEENVIGTFVADWKDFVDQLLQAKFVISSSLHGIILAESYGIPAVMWHDTASPDILKYMDWYRSTGRDNILIAKTIEEAFELKDKVEPLSRIKLAEMQKELLEAFPKDLWDD